MKIYCGGKDERSHRNWVRKYLCTSTRGLPHTTETQTLTLEYPRPCWVSTESKVPPQGIETRSMFVRVRSLTDRPQEGRVLEKSKGLLKGGVQTLQNRRRPGEKEEGKLNVPRNSVFPLGFGTSCRALRFVNVTQCRRLHGPNSRQGPNSFCPFAPLSSPKSRRLKCSFRPGSFLLVVVTDLVPFFCYSLSTYPW